MHIYYINLAHRKDRQIQIKREVKKLPWPAHRYNAIKDRNPRAGCLKSHIGVLKKALRKGGKWVCILEDDEVFLKPKKIRRRIRQARRLRKPKCDVFLISTNSAKVKHIVAPGIVRVHESLSSSGYVIRRGYIKTLIKNFERTLKKRGCLDTGWFTLQNTGQWWTFARPLAKQRPSYSDIEKRGTDYAFMLRPHRTK